MAWRLERRQALLAAVLLIAGLLLANHFYLPALNRIGPAWYLAGDALQFVIAPLAVYLLLLRPAGVTPASLGLVRVQPGRVGDTLFEAALLVGLTWPVAKFTGWLRWEYGEPWLLAQFLPVSWSGRLAAAAYLAATAAFVEETVFRALPWLYLRDTLRGRWQAPVYLLASSVLFAFCHTEQGPAGMWSAWWFGLMAAVVYLKAGKLWAPVAGHFAFDMLVFGPW